MSKPRARQNWFQTVGNRIVERLTSPSAASILGPTMLTSGLFDRKLNMGERQSSVNLTSEFTKQTYSPELFSIPMLLALANPRFSELRTRVNSGNMVAISSGVPSVDALSTTIT